METIIIPALLLVLCGLLALIALEFEPIGRRTESLSFRVQTVINRWRPKAALPTPPAVSAVDAQTLLQNRGDGGASPGATTDVPAYFDDVLNEAGATGQAQSSGEAQVQLVESSSSQVLSVLPEMTLTGFNHEWQTWNNCGPATVSMNLSFYGQPDTQIEAAQFLKPNKNDKNVSPDELLAYANAQNYEGVVGVGGTTTLLKQLLSNGFPVIVEFWTEHEDNGGMGHYRLLTGFNQAENRFVAQDSLHGANVSVPVDKFDSDWQAFNRTYVVTYPPEKTGTAHAILGLNADPTLMLELALHAAQTEAVANPNNAFAWFNIGTNYARLGEPELAASAFDEARRIGLPYRMLWYQFDIFESYLAVGRYQEVVELTTATLDATGGLEELYYYRGLAQQALNQPQAAESDFQAARGYNPNFDGMPLQ